MDAVKEIGGAAALKAAPTPGQSVRRVWVIADSHIGVVSDGLDGAAWLRRAVDDIRSALTPDYVIHLGDMTAGSQESEFREYAAIRDASGFGPWRELVGNHDFRGFSSGLYGKLVACPHYWLLRDGNNLFLSLPCEQGGAAGLFLPEVDEWLRESVRLNPGMNVIVCAHTFPDGTVVFSEREHRQLHPRDAVAAFLKDVHVDLWLGGHIHFSPRSEAHVARRGGTTYINASSISHAYGTQASCSFVLEFTPGSSRLTARCRHHDTACFADNHAVEVHLTHPVELDGPARFAGHEVPRRTVVDPAGKPGTWLKAAGA